MKATLVLERKGGGSRMALALGIEVRDGKGRR